MVKMKYVGLIDPVGRFNELKPAQRKLQEMGLKFHPASPQFKALREANDALRRAADLITEQEDFFRVVARDSGWVGSAYRRDGQS